jgi:LysR family cys regulon transcriptional activator
MGIGLMASTAFLAERDAGLRLLDCSHLFEEQTTRIAVRHGRFLRGFVYRFIELCSPVLTENVVREDLT